MNIATGGPVQPSQMSESPQSFLLRKVDDGIAKHLDESGYYRKRYVWTTVGVAALSAAVTILAGTGVGDIWEFPLLGIPHTLTGNHLIVVLSAVSGLVSVWGGLFRPRESLYIHVLAHRNLSTLRNKIKFEARKAAPGQLIAQDILDDLFSQFDLVERGYASEWTAMHMTQSNQTEKSEPKNSQ